MPSHQQSTMNNHSPQENRNDVFSPDNEVGNAHVENVLPLPDNKLVIEEEQNEQHQPSFRQTQSGRTVKNTASLEQHKERLVAWEVLIDPECVEDEQTQEQQYGIHHQLEHCHYSQLLQIHLHEALQASDHKEFLKAMDVEITGRKKGNHWIVVPQSIVPKGTKVLDAVWSLQCKQRIVTWEIYKPKA